MSDLGYNAFDADNHYYEAEDAFTRHLHPHMRRRAMDWAEVNGRRCLLVAGKVNKFIPNPTFDPVARPGCLDEYFRGRNPEGKSIRDIFGELEPLNPAYLDRDVRLKIMDTQQLDGAFFFPTLGVGMEEALKGDPEALLAAFRSFNRWIDEDWGFAYQERIFAAPYISLVDVDWAVEELEWALERDLRVLVMRSAPVETPSGSFSPADPKFDPFWARVNEAGVSVAYHSGDAGYLKFAEAWGLGGTFKAFDFNPARLCMSASPIADTLAALCCGGVFDRHPNLRVATIESGSSWVPGLMSRLKKAYGQMPFAFKSDPVEQFRQCVSVSPYYEDDIANLYETIGADHILFGSDFPHAEGLAEPISFVDDLPGFDANDVRQIMRDNGFALTRPRPA